jgi:hypothetical protein
MNGQKITTRFNVYWMVTLESYDGAPDAKGPDSLMGWGLTEQEAVENLQEQLCECE